MTIDLELIARRQRCEQSSLRIALPLLEQGYDPPFLTRYRRDELGSISERALWDVVAALRTERQLDSRRVELRGKYALADLDDAALLASIDQSQTPRQLDRIARRIRNETGHTSPASRLAVRLLNPKPNDPVELSELAELVVGAEHATPAVEGLDTVLGQYLAADSRMVQAATMWMDRHVQLHVIEVHDPHEGAVDVPGDDVDSPSDDTANTAPKSASHPDAKPKIKAESQTEPSMSGDGAPAATQVLETSGEPTEPASDTSTSEEAPQAEEVKAGEAQSAEAPDPVAGEIATETVIAEIPVTEAPAGFTTPDEAASKTAKLGGKKSNGKGKDAGDKKAAEAARKKISPRQRRRKWLVSVLQPLRGKSLTKAKLTAFQVVMLGRALRSQVAQCAFKYNAGELVNHLAKTAASLNAGASNELSQIVIDNESSIREALEAAWWDDLIDRAARRLISVASDSLRRQMNRQPIEAKNVLVIDAVGPRTAAVVAVGPDDKVLHAEDVACQLSKSVRQQLVARLGELVHQFHIDLIVVSNGPARRGCMVALSELMAQSSGGSLRWTLAERAGAEIYAGGPEGNRELRSLPRRFRAAVWLCQSVRSPARALAKVDVSKLRLGSYQRELSEKPLSGALQDVVTSGVCQISVNANAADRGWLASLPGVSDSVAEAIDRLRRNELFKSRDQILGIDAWPNAIAQRQAIGFLRVYDGTQPLDATAIHPDDYALAEKLMGRLEIPAPPSAPAGYEPPNFEVEEVKVVALDPSAPPTTFTELKVNVDPNRPFGEISDADTGSDAGAEVVGDVVADSVAETEPTQTQTQTETETETETVASDGTESELASAESATTAIGPEPTDSPATDAEEASEPVAAEVDAPEVVAEESAPAEVASEESAPAAEPPASVVEAYRYPMPEGAAISRCIKEWQVGENRVRQIIKALCEPFSDTTSDAFEPVATMSVVPKLTDLKPGEVVAGVVVGVSGFGVFVELGPECSGLIHVSRLSEDFVEDINEFLQIGDVITAWVIEIDSKRRRVSLSGISPERQAASREQRNNERNQQPRGGGNQDGRPARANQQSGARANTGNQQNTARPGGSRAPGGYGAGRPGSGVPAGGGQSGGRGDSRGGRPGGGQGKPTGGGNTRGGKPGGRRDAGSRGPTTYTAVSRSDAPKASLTDAMKTGEEPLRSFGDLMQFFKGAKESAPVPELTTNQSVANESVANEAVAKEISHASPEQGDASERPSDDVATQPAKPTEVPNASLNAAESGENNDGNNQPAEESSTTS